MPVSWTAVEIRTLMGSSGCVAGCRCATHRRASSAASGGSSQRAPQASERLVAFEERRQHRRDEIRDRLLPANFASPASHAA